MITNSNHLPIALLRFVIGVLVLFAAEVSMTAQVPPVDVEIHSASANLITTANGKVAGWSVFIAFSKSLNRDKDKTNAERAANYRIVNANTGAQVAVSQAEFVDHGAGATVTTVRLTLASSDALNLDDMFYVFALNLTFGDLHPESLPVHQIKIQSDPTGGKIVEVDDQGTDGSGRDAHKLPKPAWGLKKSKGRDDSDLYGSYELTSVRGAATTGTGDIKVSIPFPKDFWSRRSVFSPVFDFKASSDAKADPDSLKFGFEWFLPLHIPDDPNSQKVFEDIDFINTGKIEAPKNFHNINALWESKLLFPSAQIPAGGKRFRMFVNPYAGVELGKNLKSPLPELEGKALARVIVGGELMIQIPIKNLVALKGFEFNSSYVRRWPLTRELLLDKDAQGNPISLTASKGPKDYSDSKFTVKINDYFGPYIGYEWGRLPPNYELVDHKWTFGLLFKAKVRSK